VIIIIILLSITGRSGLLRCFAIFFGTVLLTMVGYLLRKVLNVFIMQIWQSTEAR